MKKFYTLILLAMALGSQLIGTVVLGLAFAPAFLLVRWAWQGLEGAQPAWQALGMGLALGAGYFLWGNCLLLSIVLVKFVGRLRVKEFKSPLLSGDVIRTSLVSWLANLAQWLFLPMVRGTIMIVWYYRAMGARIGPRTVITTVRIFDCDLIEIGADCVIGGHASLNGHTGEGARVRTRRIKIGNRVTIGADTVVLPGVTIEDGVMVAANSVVPMGTVLRAGGIYGGAPLQRLDQPAEILH